MTGLGIDLHVPARLLDEAVDHREPEARALALRLGGEERLEDLLDQLRRHAASGVGDGEHHVAAGRHLLVAAGVVVVEEGVGELDGELAAARHRVAGVDREIEHRGLDLDRIDESVPEPAGEHGLDLDRLADCAAHHVVHAGDEPAHIDDLGLERLTAPEGEQLLGELRPARHARHGVRHAALGALVADDVPGEQLQVSGHDLEQVVEVVRDAAGELADRLEFLSLGEFRLGAPALVDLGDDPRLEAFVQMTQLLLGALAMRDLAGERVGMLAERLFGGALVRDVGVDADPFLDLALRVEDRQGADREGAPGAVMATHAMLVDIHGFRRHRGVPCLDARVAIVRMDRVGPAVILIGVVALSRERRPAGLLAEHPSVGAVGPENAMDRVHGGAETTVARDELAVDRDPDAVVDDGAHHAADGAVGLVDRRVEQVEHEGVVTPVAAKRHRLVAERQKLAAEPRLEHPPVPVPDLRPDLGRRAAERLRMVRARDQRIGVVVEHDVGGPPHQHLGHRRIDDICDRRAQFERPTLDRPERREAPIARADQRTAFAAGEGPGSGRRSWFCRRLAVPQRLERRPHHVARVDIIAGPDPFRDERLELGRQRHVFGLAKGHGPWCASGARPVNGGGPDRGDARPHVAEPPRGICALRERPGRSRPRAHPLPSTHSGS